MPCLGDFLGEIEGLVGDFVSGGVILRSLVK